MSTIHINADKGDFADVVLMPGDPLRAKYIADTYLQDARQVCDVRNMYGFTGTYKGRSISVMGSGMGIPSCSIYATELIKDFGVSKIIRVGSCGAVLDDANLHDIVIGIGASTNSNVNRMRFSGFDFAALADFDLVAAAVAAAKNKNVPVKVGNIFSADLFYDPDPDFFQTMKAYNIVGVEMEAAGLYGVAAEFGAKAMTICTVADHILRGEKATSKERELGFNTMMEIALDSVIIADNY